MPLFLYELLFMAAAAAGGVTAGYWLRSRRPDISPAAVAVGPAEFTTQRDEAARESLLRVKELAERVAADVGAHNSRVREISSELSDTDCDVVTAVARLIEANDKMHQQLSSAESRLQEQAELIETHANAARTDALTGLANRRAFDDEMRERLKRFETVSEPACVMLLDVDHFKKFNDTYGHLAGDEVLKGVARVLSETARPGDIAARYGGEEFAIIFPASRINDCTEVAERAREMIAATTFGFEGQALRVTASLGLAEMLAGESIEMLVQRGDEALYASKKAGRNCGHRHTGTRIIPIIDADVLAEEESLEGEDVRGVYDAGDSLRDPVTGLSSPQVFSDDVVRRLAEHRRSGTPLSLILVRIDRYCPILDEYGGDQADVLLRVTTRFLKAASRAMDHVARIGEDSFAVLLPGAKLEDTVKIADRLRAAVSQFSFMLGGEPFEFTVSCGVGEARSSDEAPALLDRVQKALSTATNRRGNQVVFHDGSRFESLQSQTANM